MLLKLNKITQFLCKDERLTRQELTRTQNGEFSVVRVTFLTTKTNRNGNSEQSCSVLFVHRTNKYRKKNWCKCYSFDVKLVLSSPSFFFSVTPGGLRIISSATKDERSQLDEMHFLMLVCLIDVYWYFDAQVHFVLFTPKMYVLSNKTKWPTALLLSWCWLRLLVQQMNARLAQVWSTRSSFEAAESLLYQFVRVVWWLVARMLKTTCRCTPCISLIYGS